MKHAHRKWARLGLVSVTIWFSGCSSEEGQKSEHHQERTLVSGNDAYAEMPDVEAEKDENNAPSSVSQTPPDNGETPNPSDAKPTNSEATNSEPANPESTNTDPTPSPTPAPSEEEGEAEEAAECRLPKTIPVFQKVAEGSNIHLSDYLFTTDKGEKRSYRNEGVAFQVFTHQIPGTVALYRCYVQYRNPRWNDGRSTQKYGHFLTLDGQCEGLGEVPQELLGYVWAKLGPDKSAITRCSTDRLRTGHWNYHSTRLATLTPEECERSNMRAEQSLGYAPAPVAKNDSCKQPIVPTDQQFKTVPVYRKIGDIDSSLFYTTDENEKPDYLVDREEFQVFVYPLAGTIPLYRCHEPRKGHFISTHGKCGDDNGAPDKVLGFVWADSGPDRTQIYSCENMTGRYPMRTKSFLSTTSYRECEDFRNNGLILHQGYAPL